MIFHIQNVILMHCSARAILNCHLMAILLMSEIIIVEKYKKAYRKLMPKKERRGFKVHVIIYAGVNTGLITLNMLTVPQVPWFVFPLVGWGIGLANHYYFGVHRAPQSLEEYELKAERKSEKE